MESRVRVCFYRCRSSNASGIHIHFSYQVLVLAIAFVVHFLIDLHPSCLYALDLVLSIPSPRHPRSCRLLPLTIGHSHLPLLYQLLQLLRRVNVALQTKSTVDDRPSESAGILLEMHLLSQLEGKVLLLHIELFPLVSVDAACFTAEACKLPIRVWRLRVLDSASAGVRILVETGCAYCDMGSRRSLHLCQVAVGLWLLLLLARGVFVVITDGICLLLVHHFGATIKLSLLNVKVIGQF